MDKEFYVDNMLKSSATEAEAISLLKCTQEMLAVSNLRLHKIISNCPNVIEAFEGWYSPLLETMESEKNSLQDLKELQIPCVLSILLSDAQSKELCVFADASVKGTAVVAYLKVTDQHGHTSVLIWGIEHHSQTLLSLDWSYVMLY